MVIWAAILFLLHLARSLKKWPPSYWGHLHYCFDEILVVELKFGRKKIFLPCYIEVPLTKMDPLNLRTLSQLITEPTNFEPIQIPEIYEKQVLLLSFEKNVFSKQDFGQWKIEIIKKFQNISLHQVKWISYWLVLERSPVLFIKKIQHVFKITQKQLLW